MRKPPENSDGESASRRWNYRQIFAPPWDPFNRWASKRHARRCPAKPTTVALFALEQADMGVAVDTILAQLDAIEQMHDKFSLPNPVRTAAVEHAMATLLKANPPRSWSKSEKGQWALLPASIRSAITRRENDRDHELRRLQSKVARELELRREIEPNTKSVSNESKEVENEAQKSE
jgi:hypothetical protein